MRSNPTGCYSFMWRRWAVCIERFGYSTTRSECKTRALHLVYQYEYHFYLVFSSPISPQFY